MKKLISYLLLSLLLAGAAWAQENVVISPQSIVVNPVPAFTVQVHVDRDPTGEGNPAYTFGETVTINVAVGTQSYVYLFRVAPQGTVTLLSPSLTVPPPLLNAGESRSFPFVAGDTEGLHRVFALASTLQLDPTQLDGFRSEGDFAVSTQGQDSFAQTLSVIVTPIAPTAWATDTAVYTLVAPAPAPPAPPAPTPPTEPAPMPPAPTPPTEPVPMPPVPTPPTEPAPMPPAPAPAPPAPTLPAPPAPTPPAGNVFYPPLGLTLHPSMSNVQNDGAGRVNIRFSSRSTLDVIFEHFNSQILALGYTRSSYSAPGASRRIEARYTGPGNVSLELNQMGNSGNFRLRIEH